MTSDSSAYSLGKPGATTCPSGHMLVVSAEACKQITSIKSGTGVETAMFMGQTGPATFATTSDGAYETLSSPDVTVTNAKDKEMQLPKILKLDENVKEAMIDGAKFVSRATIDLDHD